MRRYFPYHERVKSQNLNFMGWEYFQILSDLLAVQRIESLHEVYRVMELTIIYSRRNGVNPFQWLSKHFKTPLISILALLEKLLKSTLPVCEVMRFSTLTKSNNHKPRAILNEIYVLPTANIWDNLWGTSFLTNCLQYLFNAGLYYPI